MSYRKRAPVKAQTMEKHVENMTEIRHFCWRHVLMWGRWNSAHRSDVFSSSLEVSVTNYDSCHHCLFTQSFPVALCCILYLKLHQFSTSAVPLRFFYAGQWKHTGVVIRHIKTLVHSQLMFLHIWSHFRVLQILCLGKTIDWNQIRTWNWPVPRVWTSEY